MASFIKKCMSNTFSTMTILLQWWHAKNNLCLRCGLDLETIHHLYQCNHEGGRGRQTASVDALQKWLEARNIDPDISIIFVNKLLYITEGRNDLPQCTNQALHSEILCIVWPSIILGFIPTSLALTQQTYFTHKGSKKMKTNGPANSSHNLETHLRTMASPQ